MFARKLLLLFTAFGGVGSALAQHPAPLAPATPALARPSQSVDTPNRPSAQPAAPVPGQLAQAVRPQPVVLINSRIIVGRGLARMNPQDITDIQVYKGVEAPAKWRSLTANGIIAVTLKPHAKPKLKTKSLAAIKRELKLRGPVSYQLDGLPLEDLSLRVASADIAGLDAQQTIGSTIVNIRLALPPPVVHPPGTILIRGVSSL